MSLRTKLLTSVALLCLGVSSTASAQSDKPIRIIVPASAGLTDTVARMVGEPMSKSLGQPVIVEDRAGAGGAIGGDAVAKARPDGSVLCLCGSAPGLTMKFLMPSLGYDPARDLIPIGQIVNIELVMVARTSLDVTTLKALIDRAHAHPNELSYGAAGYGSSTHLAAELFKQRAQVDFRLIPYKGDAQLATDLIGGQVDVAFMTVAIAAPQVRAGKMKAIAVTGRTRSKSLPDVPTMDESGLAGFYADGWYGLMAPAHTPDAVVQRLSAALLAAIAQPAFEDKLPLLGLSAAGSTPQAFNTFLSSERVRLERVINDAHIHIE